MTALKIGDRVRIVHRAVTLPDSKVYTITRLGAFVAQLKGDGRTFHSNRDVLRKVDAP